MRRYRNVRFGDSPQGAKKRQISREMDKILRDVNRAIPLIVKAVRLAIKWNAADGIGGSANLQKAADIIVNDLAEYYNTNGYSTLEKRLDDEGYFEEL